MYSVKIKFKAKGKKRYKTLASVRNYERAWDIVAERIIDKDGTIHYSLNLQYLCKGYTKQRLFPFGSTEIKYKGDEFKIII